MPYSHMRRPSTLVHAPLLTQPKLVDQSELASSIQVCVCAISAGISPSDEHGVITTMHVQLPSILGMVLCVRAPLLRRIHHIGSEVARRISAFKNEDVLLFCVYELHKNCPSSGFSRLGVLEG